MPSQVPGFEYDIFISYRQNDNQSGWVTKFVKSLNQELAATIKDPVTVYFDSNPQDGLLENHQVNQSLEQKLKCLIFIPILSQTYCDPKSYAWQHEFCAFNKLAKVDALGREIKLRNGNVASRILPIKIHDVEADDRALVEKEIGGPLRCIDFIFKSPGVNRPLRAVEDHPNDNLNKTFYRDQVNKVANAVKEILIGIKHPDSPAHEETSWAPPKRSMAKMRIGATLLLLLVVAGFYFIPKWITTASSPASDKSIAVLYFDNMSGDPGQEYFVDGITEEIISNISKIKNLRVISRNSVKAYKGQVLNLRKIADELNVTSILEGSVRRSGNRVRITAELIDVYSDKHLWVETFEEEINDILDVQTKIALEIVKRLKIDIAPEVDAGIRSIPTQSKDAYDRYLKGKYEMEKRTKDGLDQAVTLFNEAIDYDPTFVLAYAGLADSYLLIVGRGWGNPQLYMPLAKESIDKALRLEPNAAEIQASLGYWHFNNFNFREAEKFYRKAIALNPNQDNAYNWLGSLLIVVGKPKEAIDILDAGLVFNPTFRYLTGNKKYALLELNNRQLNIDSLFQKDSYQHSVVYWNLGNPEKAYEIAKAASHQELVQFYEGSNALLRADVTKFIEVVQAREDYLSPAIVAGNYGIAGDLKNFLHYANQAIEVKDPVLTTLLQNHNYMFLLPKEDPELQVVKQRIRSLIAY